MWIWVPVAIVLLISGLLPAHAQITDSLTVKETNYAVPPGALIVDAYGSRQTGEGPLFPTVSDAIRAAKDGDTIVIHQGTYREALPDIDRRLTLQPAPGAQVWLKGSKIVRDWKADADAWRHDGWQVSFCQTCFHPGNIDPKFPHAGLPEQVFVDGRPLLQVTRRSAVTPTRFYVDHARNQLFIGTDPTGKLVEVSAWPSALAIEWGGAGSVIRGLGFAHYSPRAEPGFGAAIKANADDLEFENNTIAWSAVKGLSVFGRNTKVRGNRFQHNGMMGLAAWRADGLVLQDNRFAFNNSQFFAQTGAVSEAAGAKLTKSRRLQISDNIFENNHASGLWLDIDVSNAIIARNVFRDNNRHGLFYEISANGIIASNIFAKNRVSGLALGNAANMQVYNNTFVENAISLLVQDDGRRNQDGQEIAQGNSWISGRTVFHNNLISGGVEDRDSYIYVRDFTGTLSANTMLSRSDFNGYYRRNANRPKLMAQWWGATGRTAFADLKSFQSATGKELQSVMVDNRDDHPFFNKRDGTDFSLTETSVSRNAGRDLPPAIAKAIGISEQSAPDLGALLLPGRVPNASNQYPIR